MEELVETAGLDMGLQILIEAAAAEALVAAAEVAAAM